MQKLEKENTAFKSANWNHTDEIVKLKMENRKLKKDKGKLDALVGRIGNDVLQKALEGIPLSLLVLNLVVYIFPAVSFFLTKMGRASASLVTAFSGVFTTAGFLIIHLCGAFSGLWGVWNYSYFELIDGVTWQGVFYQGVDWISWVFLFEVPALCLPSSFIAFKQYLKLKKAALEK